MQQLIDANNLMVTSRREIAFIHNGHVSVMSSPPKDINKDTNAYNAEESVPTQSTLACGWSTCWLCMYDSLKEQENLECISLIFLNFYFISV